MMLKEDGYMFERKLLACLIAAVVTMFLFLISGCGGKDGPDSISVMTGADEKFIEVAEKYGVDHACQEVVEWLKNQPGVKEAGIGEGCVYFYMEDGTNCILHTDLMQEER